MRLLGRSKILVLVMTQTRKSQDKALVWQASSGFDHFVMANTVAREPNGYP